MSQPLFMPLPGLKSLSVLALLALTACQERFVPLATDGGAASLHFGSDGGEILEDQKQNPLQACEFPPGIHGGHGLPFKTHLAQGKLQTKVSRLEVDIPLVQESPPGVQYVASIELSRMSPIVTLSPHLRIDTQDNAPEGWGVIATLHGCGREECHFEFRASNTEPQDHLKGTVDLWGKLCGQCPEHCDDPSCVGGDCNLCDLMSLDWAAFCFKAVDSEGRELTVNYLASR